MLFHIEEFRIPMLINNICLSYKIFTFLRELKCLCLIDFSLKQRGAYMLAPCFKVLVVKQEAVSLQTCLLSNFMPYDDHDSSAWVARYKDLKYGSIT